MRVELSLEVVLGNSGADQTSDDERGGVLEE